MKTIESIGNLENVCYIGQNYKLSSNDILHLNNLIKDQNHCSSSYQSLKNCQSTDIIICGAYSNVKNSMIFTEYKIVDQEYGKYRYKGIHDNKIEIRYYYSYFSISNYWGISIDKNLIMYNYDNDIIDSNKWYDNNWKQDKIIVSHKKCCNINISIIGDGVCDSLANNKECYWDGGDWRGSHRCRARFGVQPFGLRSNHCGDAR